MACKKKAVAGGTAFSGSRSGLGFGRHWSRARLTIMNSLIRFGRWSTRSIIILPPPCGVSGVDLRVPSCFIRSIVSRTPLHKAQSSMYLRCLMKPLRTCVHEPLLQNSHTKCCRFCVRVHTPSHVLTEEWNEILRFLELLCANPCLIRFFVVGTHGVVPADWWLYVHVAPHLLLEYDPAPRSSLVSSEEACRAMNGEMVVIKVTKIIGVNPCAKSKRHCALSGFIAAATKYSMVQRSQFLSAVRTLITSPIRTAIWANQNSDILFLKKLLSGPVILGSTPRVEVFVTENIL